MCVCIYMYIYVYVYIYIYIYIYMHIMYIQDTLKPLQSSVCFTTISNQLNAWSWLI